MSGAERLWSGGESFPARSNFEGDLAAISERSPTIGKPAGKRAPKRSSAAGDDHDFVSESEVAHFGYGQSSELNFPV